jgi:hypothetical protein
VYDVKASAINFIDFVSGVNKLTFRVKQYKKSHVLNFRQQPGVKDFAIHVDHEKQIIYIGLLASGELTILQDESLLTRRTAEYA